MTTQTEHKDEVVRDDLIRYVMDVRVNRLLAKDSEEYEMLWDSYGIYIDRTLNRNYREPLAGDTKRMERLPRWVRLQRWILSAGGKVSCYAKIETLTEDELIDKENEHDAQRKGHANKARGYREYRHKYVSPAKPRSPMPRRTPPAIATHSAPQQIQ